MLECCLIGFGFFFNFCLWFGFEVWFRFWVFWGFYLFCAIFILCFLTELQTSILSQLQDRLGGTGQVKYPVLLIKLLCLGLPS